MDSVRLANVLTSALLGALTVASASSAYAQTSERQLALKQSAEARVAKGEVPPAKGNDPGDPIMRCGGVEPVPFRVSDDVLRVIGSELVGMFSILVGAQSVMCANSEEGARVLAYREWYCGGKEAACTLSVWSNGEPTFSKPQDKGVNFDLSSTAPGAQTPSVRLKFTLDPVYK